MKIRILFAGMAFVFAGAAWAKLPPAPPADPAKAAEAKKKTDDAAKKDAELLSKAQDRAAANYHKSKGKSAAAAGKAATKKK